VVTSLRRHRAFFLWLIAGMAVAWAAAGVVSRPGLAAGTAPPGCYSMTTNEDATDRTFSRPIDVLIELGTRAADHLVAEISHERTRGRLIALRDASRAETIEIPIPGGMILEAHGAAGEVLARIELAQRHDGWAWTHLSVRIPPKFCQPT
jgi:hypothetical protein